MITPAWRRWIIWLCLLSVGCIESPASSPQPEPLPAQYPRIEIDPLGLDFQAQVGLTQTRTVTLTNRGEGALELFAIERRGSANFSLESAGSDAERPEAWRDPDGDGEPGLAPGASMMLDITFSPVDPALDLGTVLIVSNDPARPELAIELRGRGPVTCAQLDPSNIDFGTLDPDTARQAPLQISICADSPYRIQAVQLTEESDPAFSLADLSMALPTDRLDLAIEFAPEDAGEYHGDLLILTDSPEAPTLQVPLRGAMRENECPVALATDAVIEAVPGDVVTLDGSPSTDDGPDGRPVEYEWVIVDSPDGSVSLPVERFFNNRQPANGGEQDDRTTPTAQFFVDLQGIYVFELRVRDAQGLGSLTCENAARVVVDSQGIEHGIRVELSWASPVDQPNELGLHLLHPNADGWFSSPYDCHAENVSPDWGQLDNPADDPNLSQQGTNRVIELDLPEMTQHLGAPYLVGVSAVRLTQPTAARVRIYIRDELVWDYTGEGQPGERVLDASGHFWDAASIDWPSGEVRTRDRYSTGRRP